MDFNLTHEFAAPIDAVSSAMVDPAFYGTFTIPDVGPFTTTGPDIDGATTTLHVRYEYTGSLDPMVKKFAGGEIVLLQNVSVETGAHGGALDVRLEKHGDLLTCSGNFAFTESEGTTTRTLDGELKVHVPLMGGKAERSLLPGILDRLGAEAAALQAYLG